MLVDFRIASSRNSFRFLFSLAQSCSLEFHGFGFRSSDFFLSFFLLFVCLFLFVGMLKAAGRSLTLRLKFLQSFTVVTLLQR
jgi:hypothetical protein